MIIEFTTKFTRLILVGIGCFLWAFECPEFYDLSFVLDQRVKGPPLRVDSGWEIPGLVVPIPGIVNVSAKPKILDSVIEWIPVYVVNLKPLRNVPMVENVDASVDFENSTLAINCKRESEVLRLPFHGILSCFSGSFTCASGNPSGPSPFRFEICCGPVFPNEETIGMVFEKFNEFRLRRFAHTTT